ncbi:LapA family protein [Micromonospora sp. URMC 103]|uniref:LapA family protein n=1 Tax=Micromonospora sp. URMC 103 TaxID=3423406 RepID=UPI003F1D2456
MARFGSVRFTNVQSGPEINDRPRLAPRVRTGGSLVPFGASALLLLLLLIFILQNGQRTDVHLFGMRGQVPVGVALLLAAVSGVLLVTLHAATRRIIQLRLPARRHRAPTTVGRPDSADYDQGTAVPKGRNS